MQFAMIRRLSGILACFGIVLFALPALAQDRPATPGGIYDKPYIEEAGRGTAIGGYIDMEWEITEDKNTFDQHRFIPFIFSEINDRIHFATEIEFEHGGRVPGDGEIKLEFAALDIQFTEWLTYRTGVLLAPLGKFNLVHDSPWNDFVSRPLVNRQLIPTTLSESGMGFHGTIYPSEMGVLGYELYLVNGFNEGIIAGPNQVRTRGGRGSLASDNNQSKSLVGRLVYSPVLGMEFGGSFHTGNYDDGDELRLSILGLDATLQKGPFELLLETAYSSTEMMVNSTVGQLGYYVQPNYHFGFGLIPGFPESKFTAMARLGRINYNMDADGDIANRYTVGLNWRPIEDTAVKVEYLIQEETPLNSTTANESEGTFFFGATSYF
ncbi:MAG: hypothetical protein K9N46_13900 [Candidatus Marinimicrobia bacterium]|nr:hypothetical protein [Candidatus Neomarinimicrobiota bacterium]MCF7829042.1 hypothetical protein [Candidatus Neomarinimicrobiota bacterium]MCF7881821.1 hypothetical protein [Candidatus Neomarinimicrobiota bacterium]